MIDADRVLRPLRAEAAAIERLATYGTPADLADALAAVGRASEHCLRLLLRSDTAAPEDARMTALSAGDLPFDRVIAILRQNDRITMQLAGRLHDLERAAARAAGGSSPRPTDADAATLAIEQLEAEVRRLSADVPAPLPEPVPEEGAGGATRARTVVALLVVVAAAAAVMLWAGGRTPDVQAGIDAFAAGDLTTAAARFETALGADSVDVTALLYLGRIHRRQARFEAAARVLERAAALEPRDAHVRRELGWLFMDLARPGSAAEQFERARAAQPGDASNWIGLIRALRAAGDPLAEQRLREAPPEVRAEFASSG